jgi:DNA adenine methylase
MKKNRLVAPVVKWVGGKRQLLVQINKLLPPNFAQYKYCEPFIGGGAVLFHLQPKKALINDANTELINVYKVIREDIDCLIEELKQFSNTAEVFYEVRGWDKNPETYNSLSDAKKAARFLFLNKTCFNGLYRVNNAGEFNTPFGSYKNPNFINEPTLRAVHSYFISNSIELHSGDYQQVLDQLEKKSFVYLDPPYDPVSTTSNFTGYTKGGFNRDEQIRLKEACDKLDKKGIKFLLSNSSTEFIHTLYSKYTIEPVQAKRAINSVASGRGNIEEVLVKNY